MPNSDRVPGSRRSPERRRESHDRQNVLWLFGTFGLLLVANVVLSWYLQSQDASKPGGEGHAWVAQLVAVAFDSTLVLLTFALCRNSILPSRGLGKRRILGWSLAVPAIAILLLANFGYHRLMLTLSGTQAPAPQLSPVTDYWWWSVALVCVQPAIVEELFFRKLAFDYFCEATSPGTAAFVSAMMFAAVHTAGFLGIPYLVAFGVCLAWLRWFTGSLALTMGLHFLHNLLLLLWGY